MASSASRGLLNTRPSDDKEEEEEEGDEEEAWKNAEDDGGPVIEESLHEIFGGGEVSAASA